MEASSRTLQHIGEWKVEVRADTVETERGARGIRDGRRRPQTWSPAGAA